MGAASGPGGPLTVADRRGPALGVPRWAALAVFAAFSVLSLIALEVDYRGAMHTLGESVVAVDNLTQARLEVAQSYLSWERVRQGDPTFDRTRPLAELDAAIDLLDDFREGRSALLGFGDGRPITDPRLLRLTASYERLLRGTRADLLQAGPKSLGPVALRLRFSRMETTAEGLEQRMHAVLRGRVAQEEQRHLLFLIAWAGFLAVTGAGIVGLRRSRREAQVARVRSERKRAVVERRYATVEALTAAGTVRADAEGRVIEASSWWSRELGVDVGAWTARPWWDVFVPDAAERASDTWRRKAPRGEAFSVELPIVTGSGSTRWLLAHWAAAESGGVTRDHTWVGTFLDVTDSHSLEEQLQQAQKLEAIGRLTGGIAHDFNNLLTVTLNNVDLLRSEHGAALDAEAAELVGEVADAAAGGKELVGRLMGFGRRAHLVIRPVDLGRVVQDSVRLARKLIPDRVRFEVVTPPDGGPRVRADPRAVEQILLNLVSNACDAMPEGGTLTLAVDSMEADEAYREAHTWIEPGRYGRLAVRDTGTGMDAATLARIFDPFFTTKPEGIGTGLGLATVHGLVRQHGGHVHAYSEPGRGTTFRVYFPEAATGAGAETAREETRPSAPLAATGRPLRVLLVEDDEALRRTARRILVRLGHDVSEASDGAAALRALEAGAEIDLVISDVSMEGMGGRELFRRLRSRGDEHPFLFTSGHSSEEMAGDPGMPAGAVFLSKPWTVDELRAAIVSAMRRLG